VAPNHLFRVNWDIESQVRLCSVRAMVEKNKSGSGVWVSLVAWPMVVVHSVVVLLVVCNMVVNSVVVLLVVCNMVVNSVVWWFFWW
jgi:hypothetical protein